MSGTAGGPEGVEGGKREARREAADEEGGAAGGGRGVAARLAAGGGDARKVEGSKAAVVEEGFGKLEESREAKSAKGEAPGIDA